MKNLIDVTPDTIKLWRVYTPHCQVCGKSHNPIALVYFVPLDNNLVCRSCAVESGLEYETRIYMREGTP
jgi:recombinational DNA repair protein (RecF pathway)